MKLVKRFIARFGLRKFLWSLVLLNFMYYYQFFTWNTVDNDNLELKLKLPPSSSQQQCERNDHIVYIKTYKTASSTMVNLLYR